MMNHRRLFAAALVLLFVAGLFGVAAAAKSKPAGKAPKLLITTKTAQMGEVLEGQDITHTFIIKNIGDAEAQILSVRPG
jgi:hypothetical protein